MARYRGPKDKLNRRFGIALFGPSKSLERRAYGPGQHGPRRGRRKQSDYAIALAEKQKLKYQYGVLEKQFRRYFAEASRRRGITGEILLQLLESRLDNVVYRLGMANTRSASRQFVGHGHVLVNGGRVDIPSYVCKAGDVISVRDNARSRQVAIRFLDITQAAPVPDWVSVDRDALTGIFSRVPSREEIAPIVNEQLIVELYSR
ncbi:MAG: small subunit ribosomal protein S4 [Verrucomicrobiales bacterium]|jgi:small subunit ribosomal protein S4